MFVRTVVAFIIIVSLPLVLFTYLVETDVIDVSFFGETFFTGLEETTELGIQMKTTLEEKIVMTFYP